MLGALEEGCIGAHGPPIEGTPPGTSPADILCLEHQNSKERASKAARHRNDPREERFLHLWLLVNEGLKNCVAEMVSALLCRSSTDVKEFAGWLSDACRARGAIMDIPGGTGLLGRVKAWMETSPGLAEAWCEHGLRLGYADVLLRQDAVAGLTRGEGGLVPVECLVWLAGLLLGGKGLTSAFRHYGREPPRVWTAASSPAQIVATRGSLMVLLGLAEGIRCAPRIKEFLPVDNMQTKPSAVECGHWVDLMKAAMDSLETIVKGDCAFSRQQTLVQPAVATVRAHPSCKIFRDCWDHMAATCRLAAQWSWWRMTGKCGIVPALYYGVTADRLADPHALNNGFAAARFMRALVARGSEVGFDVSGMADATAVVFWLGQVQAGIIPPPDDLDKACSACLSIMLDTCSKEDLRSLRRSTLRLDRTCGGVNSGYGWNYDTVFESGFPKDMMRDVDRHLWTTWATSSSRTKGLIIHGPPGCGKEAMTTWCVANGRNNGIYAAGGVVWLGSVPQDKDSFLAHVFSLVVPEQDRVVSEYKRLTAPLTQVVKESRVHDMELHVAKAICNMAPGWAMVVSANTLEDVTRAVNYVCQLLDRVGHGDAGQWRHVFIVTECSGADVWGLLPPRYRVHTRSLHVDASMWAQADQRLIYSGLQGVGLADDCHGTLKSLLGATMILDRDSEDLIRAKSPDYWILGAPISHGAAPNYRSVMELLSEKAQEIVSVFVILSTNGPGHSFSGDSVWSLDTIFSAIPDVAPALIEGLENGVIIHNSSAGTLTMPAKTRSHLMEMVTQLPTGHTAQLLEWCLFQQPELLYTIDAQDSPFLSEGKAHFRVDIVLGMLAAYLTAPEPGMAVQIASALSVDGHDIPLLSGIAGFVSSNGRLSMDLTQMLLKELEVKAPSSRRVRMVCLVLSRLVSFLVERGEFGDVAKALAFIDHVDVLSRQEGLLVDASHCVAYLHHCKGMSLVETNQLDLAAKEFRFALDYAVKLEGVSPFLLVLRRDFARAMNNGLSSQHARRLLEEIQGDNAFWHDDLNRLEALVDLCVSVKKASERDNVLKAQEKILESYTHRYGPKYPRRIAAQRRLAPTLKKAGDLQGSARMSQEVLEISNAVYGSDHPDSISALEDVALSVYDLGDHERALGMLEDVHSRRRRVLGTSDPRYFAAVHNMGGVLLAAGRTRDAVARFREASEGRQKTLGEESVDHITSLLACGRAQRAQGDLTGALDTLQKVRDLKKRVYGESHPDYLLVLNDLASLTEEVNGSGGEAALEMLAEANRGLGTTLGTDDPRTLIAMANEAWNHFKNGDFDKAHDLFQTLVKKHKAVSGDKHKDYLSSLSGLAITKRERGEHLESLRMFQEVWSKRCEAHGREHEKSLEALRNIGSLENIMGTTEACLATYREVARIEKKILDFSKEELRLDHLATLESLGNLLCDAGEFSEAVDAYKEMRVHLRRGGPEDSNAALQAGLALHRKRDMDGAELLLKEARKGFRKLGPRDPNYLGVLHHMGTLYCDMTRVQEGMAHYHEALVGRREALGRHSMEYLTTLMFVAEMLSKMNAVAEAMDMLQQVTEALTRHVENGTESYLFTKTSELKRIIMRCGGVECSQDGSLRCSRCESQWYCSRECQAAHWKAHKKICSKGRPKPVFKYE